MENDEKREDAPKNRFIVDDDDVAAFEIIRKEDREDLTGEAADGEA